MQEALEWLYLKKKQAGERKTFIKKIWKLNRERQKQVLQYEENPVQCNCEREFDRKQKLSEKHQVIFLKPKLNLNL